MHSLLGRSSARLCCGLTITILSAPANAAITSIQGSVRSSIQETLIGGSGDSVEVSDDLPGTTNQFPLVAIAQLLDDASSGAGSVASQLSDPATSTEVNPSEFALNLALVSVDASRQFSGLAHSQEVREILFSTSEFPGTQDGDEVQAQGLVWIDGATTIFSVDPQRDLSGAEVVIKVSIVHSTAGQVFSGDVRLTGSGPGDAVRTTSGDFSNITAQVTELGALNPDFGAVWIVAIPEATVSYDFDGVIGEPFTLTTTYELEARNLPDGVGCAGVVGTPFESLAQVVSVTQDDGAAARLNQNITSQRDAAGRSQPALLCPFFGAAMTMVPLAGIARRKLRKA